MTRGPVIATKSRGLGQSTQLLRRVEGITYWVIDGPKQIRKFINTNLRQEWKKDAETDGVDPGRDPWLRDLSKMEWSLQTIAMAKVRPSLSMMRRQEFIARLKERSKELRRAIELYDQVIWPVIIQGNDSMLKDGYCRYTTLKTMGVKRTLAYVGH